jgi:hypothetical protein
LIYATKLLLIKTGFFRDTNSLHLDALDDWTRQRLPVFSSDVLANKESASTSPSLPPAESEYESEPLLARSRLMEGCMTYELR